MEAYTIEDVEVLRRKSGMTYQEAAALLEYHEGNLAKALIDLEKNGKLREAQPRTAGNGAAGQGGFKAFVRKMYQTRVKIHKGDTPVLNLSILYAVPCLVCAPHITVAGIIVSMILGYRFSFSQADGDFAAVEIRKPEAATEKKDEAPAAAPAAPSAVQLSKELNEQVDALTEKEIPTIQVPVQATC